MPKTKETTKKSVSGKNKELEALIEKYKEQSPLKYEAKREELEAKLKSL